jgi:hypothetical protein
MNDEKQVSRYCCYCIFYDQPNCIQDPKDTKFVSRKSFCEKFSPRIKEEKAS